MTSEVEKIRAGFREDLAGVLVRLREGRLRVRVAARVDLHRRRPGGHFHATPELFLQRGGATEFECPGGDFRLGSGEVCVMPLGVSHQETPRDGRTPYDLLVCMERSEGIYLHRARTDPTRRILGYGTFPLVSRRAREAFRYLDEMPEGERLGKVEGGRFRRVLLEAFLMTVLGELAGSVKAEEGLRGTRLVVEAQHLVGTHLGSAELSVAGLARNLGCSADHLSRVFHAERGVTLGVWITGERIVLAKELLDRPEFNVAEVGWACGFKTPSYFIRVFRQRVGMTPRGWRMRQR